jgi:hypothetical protein
VDDVVIFLLNLALQEVGALLRILTNLGVATRLRLNMAKCSMVPIRCFGLNLDHILDAFTGQWVSFPITYLGLPLTLGQQSILYKAKARLAGWQGHFLKSYKKERSSTLSPKCDPGVYVDIPQGSKAATGRLGQSSMVSFWADDNEISGGKCKVGWPLITKPV